MNGSKKSNPVAGFTHLRLLGFKLSADPKAIGRYLERLNFDQRLLLFAYKNLDGGDADADRVLLSLDLLTDGDSFSTRPNRVTAMLLRVPLAKSYGETTVAFDSAYFVPLAVTDDPEFLYYWREVLGITTVLGQFKHKGGEVTVSMQVYGDGPHPFAADVAIVSYPKTATALPVAGWPAGPFQTVQLKQIRDGAYPEQGCYRTLVAATHMLEAPDVTRPDAPAKVTFNRFRNFDLFKELGLLPGEQSIAGGDWYEAGRTQRASLPSPSAQAISNTRRFAIRAAPRYIEERGDLRVPPPYRFRGVRVRGFKLPALKDSLDELCESMLNVPEQGFRYQAATGDVVLEILYYPDMHTDAPPNEWRQASDTFSQHEMVLRILVGKTEEASASATEPKVFCPFIFVDQAASMIAGREVIGLPKRCAHFKWPVCNDEWSPDERVRVVARFGDPDSESSETLPLSVHVDYQGFEDGASKLGPVDALPGSSFQGVLPWGQEDFRDIAFRRRFAREWMAVRTEAFNAIQRKRIRDQVDPEHYCYNEFVECRYQTQNFRVALPEASAKIEFKDDGGRFAELLGLESGPLIVSPGSWYAAVSDFTLEAIDPYI